MLEVILLLACPFTSAQKDAFIVCYDTQHQRPFWTAHQFTPGQSAAPGKHWRKDHELNSLPSAAFTNSGFDRGHLVAAADAPESNDTFLTSNAIAQNPTLNRGDWRRLENRIRKVGQPAVVITGAFDWSCGNERIEAPCYLFKLVRFAAGDILITVLPNAPLKEFRQAPATKSTHATPSKQTP